MKFYAVRCGRQRGIYSTWEACRSQVEGYPGAQYKSFSNLKDAEDYVFSSTVTQQSHISSKSELINRSSENPSAIHIWVDGACIQQANGNLRLGWAYVVRADGEEIQRDSGSDIPDHARQHRNVAGEIMAVLKAVSWCQAQGIWTIIVHHDYQGLASWVTGAWKAKTPWTQAYAENLRTSGIAIQWKKVKAHSGEPVNELVDRLAREAALRKEDT